MCNVAGSGGEWLLVALLVLEETGVGGLPDLEVLLLLSEVFKRESASRLRVGSEYR